MRRSRDRDAPDFERFTQAFEYFSVEFGFVEEQYAEMGQRDFAGLGRISAADERDRTGRVMRRAKRPLPPFCGRKAEHAGRQNGRRRQRFVVGHGGKKAGQACGEHRFSGARWPDHQDVMTASRRNFQCPSSARMADDIDQIRQRLAPQHRFAAAANRRQAAIG